MLLSQFLHTYRAAKLELSAEWCRQLAVTVHQYRRWLGGVARLDDLTEDLVRRFLADFRTSHAPSTTNNKRRDLLTLWQTAFEEGLAPRPPRRSRIPRCRVRPSVPEAWTPGEVGRLLLAAQTDRTPICSIAAPLWWRSLILTLYDTGERRGAALAVRTDEVHLPSASIVFHQTKTGRMRWAPLAADTVEACRAIYDPARELMWPWGASMPALEKRFRKLCQRAGIPHGQKRGGLFHKLRRTSGSLVEANGGDGALHLGNTRQVFLRSYRDPRLCGRGQLGLLPRPRI